MNSKEALKEYYDKSMTNISLDESTDQIERIIEVRKAYKNAMVILIDSCDLSQSALHDALKGLELSLMWAVKAIVMESEHY